MSRVVHHVTCRFSVANPGTIGKKLPALPFRGLDGGFHARFIMPAAPYDFGAFFAQPLGETVRNGPRQKNDGAGTKQTRAGGHGKSVISRAGAEQEPAAEDGADIGMPGESLVITRHKSIRDFLRGHFGYGICRAKGLEAAEAQASPFILQIDISHA